MLINTPAMLYRVLFTAVRTNAMHTWSRCTSQIALLKAAQSCSCFNSEVRLQPLFTGKILCNPINTLRHTQDLSQENCHDFSATLTPQLPLMAPLRGHNLDQQQWHWDKCTIRYNMWGHFIVTSAKKYSLQLRDCRSWYGLNFIDKTASVRLCLNS